MSRSQYFKGSRQKKKMNILWSGGGSQKGKVRKKIGWGEGNIFNLNNIQPEKQFKVCNICIFEEIDSFY